MTNDEHNVLGNERNRRDIHFSSGEELSDDEDIIFENPNLPRPIHVHVRKHNDLSGLTNDEHSVWRFVESSDLEAYYEKVRRNKRIKRNHSEESYDDEQGEYLN